MNKTIEERAKELYPNCDPADKLYSALIEDLRAAYIAGASENIGSTSTNTQVTTICAKELRGEAACIEVCDECKRKMQEDRFIGGNDGWTRLVDLLATHGGSIVSTASLSPEWIEQAKASNRMYVNEDGLGFVWEPDIKGIPETVEEVEWFEKWYPLKIELPEKFKTLDWMHKLPSNSKQVK